MDNKWVHIHCYFCGKTTKTFSCNEESNFSNLQFYVAHFDDTEKIRCCPNIIT